MGNIFKFLIYLLLAANSLYSLNPSLKVGMELSYPPFEMVDKEGKAIGISVSFAQELAKELQRSLVIENISFTGLIPALKSGKIELIISSLSITEERKASIDFSDPYLETGLCLLVSRKRSQIQDISEANQTGIIIAVKSGTSGEVYARKHLPLAKIIVLDKEAACVLEVVQGKADAFIYDQFSIFTNWQKNLHTTYALLTPFKKEYWAVGIRKGDQNMLEKVNAFIKKFRENRGFEKLGDQYLFEQKSAFKKLGIPFVF